MSSCIRAVVMCLVMAVAGATTAFAQGDTFTLSAGRFNALRSDDQATQYGLEYRFEQISYNIRPVVGGFGTTDGSAYGYVGFNWDVELISQFYIIPNFAVGAYHEGSGKDLGGALEFRSGIELAYEFPNEHRLGVALNHLSNASFYDKNPGSESVFVTYSIPVKWLF